MRLLTAPVQNIVVRLRLGRSSHSLFCPDCVSPSSATGGGEASSPRGTAAAVEAENAPPERFLNASTVLQEITCYSLSAAHGFVGGFLFRTRVEYR